MSSVISVVVVEDHFKQRRHLEELIAKHFPFLKVVASCSTFKEAQMAITEHQPQLWLLDVQLDGNNISVPLLQFGVPGLFEVIFITAETEYVLKNLLSNACATLVKPFNDEKFILAVNKAVQNISLKKIHGEYELLAKEFGSPELLKEKIAYRNADSQQTKDKKNDKEDDNSEDLIDFILYKNLVWLYSAGDHKTNLYYLRDGAGAPECLPATRSLGEWDEMLKNYGCFERVSRSAIVNLQYATGYNKTTGKIKLQYISGSSPRYMEFEVEASYKSNLQRHYSSVIKNPF